MNRTPRLRFGLLLVLLAAVTAPARDGAITPTERRLNLYRPATGEELAIVYRRGAEYDRKAIDRLEHFLRDSRTGDVGEIDLALYDLLYDLSIVCENRDGVFEVLRAYETPRSLDPLRRQSQVRRLDEHQRGRALHVRLRGTDLETLRDAAIKLGRGGVGYYPDRDYVHLDIGRAHSW